MSSMVLNNFVRFYWSNLFGLIHSFYSFLLIKFIRLYSSVVFVLLIKFVRCYASFFPLFLLIKIIRFYLSILFVVIDQVYSFMLFNLFVSLQIPLIRFSDNQACPFELINFARFINQFYSFVWTKCMCVYQSL